MAGSAANLPRNAETFLCGRADDDTSSSMRRSHTLRAGAVAIAGIGAMLGTRSGTSAEVQGAPLETARGEPGAAGHSAPADPAAPAAGSPPAVKRTQATLAE